MLISIKESIVCLRDWRFPFLLEPHKPILSKQSLRLSKIIHTRILRLAPGFIGSRICSPPMANNRFSFYLGFTIPNDTTYSRNGNHDLAFQNGYQLGVDYNYRFEDDSYIGAFLEGKFFDTKSVAGFSSKGSNRLLNIGFTLGQDWGLSDQLVIKTEAGIGGALTNYEIDADHYSVKDFTFYYSFLLGLEFKWSESWQTSVYYELDGRASADRIDYQSFHQLGVETGFDFKSLFDMQMNA